VISVLNKAIEELWKKLEREPSTYEIAKRMRISIYVVEKLIMLKSDIESLSRSVGEDGGNITLEDTIQDESDGPGWLTLWQQ
jgi:DNA-directed RNA polymerase sigma subunit (sigma70/sigma32)